jgi:hypothetical protein
MSTSDTGQGLGDELQSLADALRDRRPELDALALDRVKLRAFARARRAAPRRKKELFMRSRLTTVLTVVFLSAGTGGALAVAGGHVLGSDSSGSASCEQYRPGNGYGDKNHCHTGPPGQQGESPGHSGEAPGHSGEAPGHSGEEHGHGH